MKNEIDGNFLSNIKYDLPAGLVVYLVALPLCLGIALASGAPPLAGIIAGLIGGIVIGTISGSAIGVSGPAAGLTSIVATAITDLEKYEYFLLAVVAGGIFQIILGVARAGIIGDYFPSSVIKGMLAAIGMTLILKQIPHAFGFDKDAMGEMDFQQIDGHNTFSEIYYAIKFNSLGAIVISSVCLGILILWQQNFFKKSKILSVIPSSLVVVLVGTILNEVVFKIFVPSLFLSSEHLVNIPIFESFDSLKSGLSFPDISFFELTPDEIAHDITVSTKVNTILTVGFTLALVGSLETLLSVEASDKLDPFKRVTPTNKELVAQGIGNALSGLIGGLPITQVIVRSSANVNSGGRTKISAIVHGILLLVSVLAIPSVLNKIPLSCLSAILLMIGYKLTNIQLFKDMFSKHIRQYLPFVATIVVIMITNLLVGVLVGLIWAVYYILADSRDNEPYDISMEPIDGDYNHLKVRFKLYDEIHYLAKNSLLVALHDIPENSEVIIDGSDSKYISSDIKEVILDFHKNVAHERNIKIKFKESKIEFHEVDNKLLDELDSLGKLNL